MKMLRILTVAALASSATLAMADEKVITEDGIASFSTFKPGSVRAEVGTTGYGGAISWSANPYVGITLGYNGGDISWSDDVSVNGTKYDLDMDNNLTYLNAEIRPFANWFYVAAGVAYVDSKYDLNKRINDGGTLTIGNSGDYQVSTTNQGGGNVEGKLSYDNQIAPYLGLGFSPSITNRWGVFGEVGAYYTGNPTAEIYTNNLAPVNGNPNSAITARDDLKNELENKSKYEWLPVAKLGVSFRF